MGVLATSFIMSLVILIISLIAFYFIIRAAINFSDLTTTIKKMQKDINDLKQVYLVKLKEERKV